MPIGSYEWMEREQFDAMDWTKFKENAKIGYILEVDLFYPEDHHISHNSLPLAPHRMKISEKDISPFSKKCLQQLKATDKHNSQKLVSSFLQRKNYAVHAANLALYLELGMQLTHIHRVMTFEQSNFLQDYIKFCTRKRAQSTSEFRKRLFKLFSNSNFGKFIENRRKYLECEIVFDKQAFEKVVTSPRYSNHKVLSTTGIVAVFMKQRRIYMSQAWTIGFTILERSKGLIYSDFYKRIRPALGDHKNCSVLFTDTDSLCLCIKSHLTKDQVLEKLDAVMDYSNYPKDHPRYSPVRANQLGFWKDEMQGSDLIEFVGLASKTYSMRVKSTDDIESSQSKCKGVGKGFRRRIPFDEYKKCILAINDHRVTQYSIQSKDHVIRTMKTDRLCFSSFDDKRWIFDCGKHSVPFGSYLIDDYGGICPFC
jgi:hypothetical protein